MVNPQEASLGASLELCTWDRRFGDRLEKASQRARLLLSGARLQASKNKNFWPRSAISVLPVLLPSQAWDEMEVFPWFWLHSRLSSGFSTQIRQERETSLAGLCQ